MAGVQFDIGFNSSKATKELHSFQKKTESVAKSIAKGFKERIGHKIFDGLSGAAREIPQYLMEAVHSASALNEEIGKSSAVFGESAEIIKSWSQTTASSLGVSRIKALEATGSMGNMLRAFGITGEEAANMSIRLVQLAADMGSFNNASIEDTVFAIGAALRGENEPIRKFGVALDDARLKEKALELGLYDGKGALDANAKAMAAYSQILAQTEIQHGNFAATSGDLANSQKILSAKFEDFKAEIGEAFLPIMKDAVDVLNSIDVSVLAENIGYAIQGFKDMGQAIVDVHNYLADLEESLGIFGANSAIREFFNTVFGPSKLEIPIIETPDWLKEEEPEMTEADKREQQLQEAMKEWPKVKAQREEEAKQRKAMLEDQIAAEFELAEWTAKQRKEKEEKLKAEQKALALEKMQKDIAERKKGISDLQSQLESATTRSTVTAVSSMQAIGGGGGVYGELNIQKTIMEIQRDLLTETKAQNALLVQQANLMKPSVAQ